MKYWMMSALALCGLNVQAAELAAVLQWSQRAELSLPVSGQIKAVLVEEGERVKKGQPLLQLDDRILASRVDEASAALLRLKEDAAEARRELARVQELFDRGVIPSIELDQARLRQATADGKLAETQAQQRRAQQNREDATLRAPFDAIVLARQAEPGQAIAAGLKPQSLLIVARSGEMLARAQLPENQLNHFRPGQTIDVTVGKQNFKGAVKNVSLEPASRDKNGDAVYWLQVSFNPGDAPLRSGMKAVLHVPGVGQ